jgi:hypothetical protein
MSKNDPYPEGECFANVVKYAIAMDLDMDAGVKVAHGHVNQPPGKPSIRHHAWLQVDGNVVDPTVGIHESKANLRQRGFNYVAEQCYTPGRAMRLAIHHGHWGPFTARERKAVLR